MRDCAKKCVISQKACAQKECRMWIDYKKDLNCTAVAVELNPEMTFKEVAKRLQLSIVRIKQIQDKALQKLKQNALFFK
mgnify:CR=1 FL=1